MSAARNWLARRVRLVYIISHAPLLIEGLRFSPREFYARVEKALAVRAIPNLSVTRVDWKEGGPLSKRREYLRLTRERLIFDVCAAPFGTGFFVSLWFGQRPLRIGWVLLLLLILSYILFVNTAAPQLSRALDVPRETLTHTLQWLIAIGLLFVFFRVGPNLDQFLISVPVVGFFYERYFRRITYYRIDMNCMYRAAVEAAVREVIADVARENGIQPMFELAERPLLRSLIAQSNALMPR
jgi:hypothetical protein